MSHGHPQGGSEASRTPGAVGAFILLGGAFAMLAVVLPASLAAACWTATLTCFLAALLRRTRREHSAGQNHRVRTESA